MKTVIISLKIFLFLTILTGIIYPALITGIAQIVSPGNANGSLVYINNKAVGSELIGQTFDNTIYFSSRPSATGYNSLPSGGSNFGLTNSTLKKLFVERRKQFVDRNHTDSLSLIPAEMLFASASGLDPHISPEAALIQVNRISMQRHLNNDQIKMLLQKIKEMTENPQFFCLGEDRINVLLLNIELDKIGNSLHNN
jgi:potassium-transporting ATPase KdpC subunit